MAGKTNVDDFSIRPYQQNDRDEVISLWRLQFSGDPPWNRPEDVISRKESIQASLFLVGSLGDRLVGTVLAGFDGVRGWVHHLAVVPDQQRRGYAGKLMDRAEEGLLELGCPKLNLQVRVSNAGVVAFYESRGYAVDNVISLGEPLGPWRRDS